MAARLGLVTGQGLSEVIRNRLKNPLLKWLVLGLVIIAVFVGNTAYEAGNISGGVIGLQLLAGADWYHPLLIGLVAAILLWRGNYKLLERMLIALVTLMGISFIAVAIAIKPDWAQIANGLFHPKIEEGELMLVLGLIGTTVVPYNLFLHASLVREKWHTSADLKFVRTDTIVSVTLGGLVSMAIIVAATALQKSGVSSPADLASSLVPIYGPFAKIIFAIGILAAGLTSAITAPLAAAYVVQGCLGWEKNLKSSSFRVVWAVVMGTGVLFASLGFSPLKVITLAQVANALLLPVMAFFLFWLVNTKLLGRYRNNLRLNLLGLAVLIICVALGAKVFTKLIL
jgi:Mn2+/Fe2+ NRAMP family transporter